MVKRFNAFTATAAACAALMTASAAAAVPFTPTAVDDGFGSMNFYSEYANYAWGCFNVLTNDSSGAYITGYTQPSQGGVSHYGDGYFCFGGPLIVSESFTYTVSDGSGTDEATVYLYG